MTKEERTKNGNSPGSNVFVHSVRFVCTAAEISRGNLTRPMPAMKMIVAVINAVIRWHFILGHPLMPSIYV
jgi:hypothetical protein